MTPTPAPPADASAGRQGALPPSLPLHPLRRLLVLEADLVDQFGVDPEFLIHLDGPRARVRLAIVDRDLDFERAETRPSNPLGHLRGIRHRAPGHIEPETVAKADGLDDERVPVPRGC